ncbi:DUF1540 domain-containing protein [Clostridium sp. SM-530-WT-3G]|uniref:DUF1540 domain-containing protein n=1 Tax=Clostridium sp. SM-530-WT-3G TaxID=2725303 RepID=UPI00145CBE84|nr:DUF1540 domain-containing protein [Clostridium sp. SM-530-WT-3G]
MQKINCDVCNCSHNKNNVCYSNTVDIGGMSASSDSGTCCGSFLIRSLYGDLTSNTNSSGPCDALICSVETCTHNCNKLCDLQSINVSGSNSQIYSETKCASFEKQEY